MLMGHRGPGLQVHERSRMGAGGQGAGSRGAEQDGRGVRGERDGEGDEAKFGGLGKPVRVQSWSALFAGIS
jgi:hypothetical protein